MGANRITFKLVGSDDDRGHVAFAEFVKFCESVERCLRRSEAIVTGDERSEIVYRVADLKCASATIVLEATRPDKGSDSRKEVLGFFRNAVSGIEEGNIDPRINIDDLHAFREIASPLHKAGAAKVVIGRLRLSEAYKQNIDKLLSSGIATQGCLTGKVEKVNLHNRNEFVLYPVAGSQSVTCVFSEELWEQVKSSLRGTASVIGTLFYREGSTHPHRAHVTGIEIHPSDDKLPTLHDVAALGRWGTDGLSSVDFVRSLRDE